MSATSIVFNFSASGVGPIGIAVVNPDGQWSTHNAQIEFGGPLSTPRVVSISPNTLGSSASGQVINVVTTGVGSGATINLRSPLSRDVVTDFLQVSPGNYRLFGILNVQGTWSVAVYNADGGTTAYPFTVGAPLANPGALPVIDSVRTSTITAADAPQSITIFGKNFQPDATATFANSSAAPSYATLLYAAQTATMTASQMDVSVSLPVSGTLSVFVRNPDGNLSNAKSVTVKSPPPATAAPTITSATPLPGANLLAKQSFTVTGSGFTQSTTVVVLVPPVVDLSSPSVSNVSLTFVNSTTVSIRDYIDRPGVWRISVATPAGSSNTFSFTVPESSEAPPVITSIDSIYNSVQRVQNVRIHGSNFKPGLWVRVVFDDSVKFNLTPSSGIDSVTSTTVWLSNYALESGRMQVQNPTGPRSNIARVGLSAPPPYVNIGGGAAIVQSPVPTTQTISGLNLQPGLTVVLLDPNRSPRVFTGLTTTMTSIRLTATFDAPGYWRVVATNPDGHVSGPDGGFSVRSATVTPTPTVTDVTPASPAISANPQLLTISGTGFLPGATVDVAPSSVVSAPATLISGDAVKNLTSTSLQVLAPLYIPGTWTIIVTNPDGKSGQTTLRLAGTAPAPVATAVPQAPFALNGAVPFSVIGTGFSPGATAILTDPAGQTTTLAAILWSPGTVQLYMSFLETGTWSLVVKNIDGQTSNAVTFVVQ
jgi:hypothetical protein